MCGNYENCTIAAIATNMGVQTDSNGSLLIPMLLKKLRRNNYVEQYLEQILGQIVSLMIYEQRFVMK